jgi:8-oxo-dGTP pyrophosphatase MutT (NUDIX family)
MGASQQSEAIKETAGGGVVYRADTTTDVKSEPEILLIHRRGLWDLPKGKLEPNESIEECAQREVAEEVGCPWPTIQDELDTTYHSFTRDGQSFDKTTYWYAMQIPDHVHQELIPQAEEQIDKLEWVPLYEAKQRVAFENLKSLLMQFHRWYYEKR